MHSMQPLVSVIMTAYNREKYIAEAIESVIHSTYETWELIIVDDCSKDRTVEIARSYEAKDQRIKVYVNEKNLGDYPNRNKAASYAKGKYLKYVDADDLIYPHGLEVMVRSMEDFPEAGLGLALLRQDNKRPAPVLLAPTEAYYINYFEHQIFTRAPLSAIIKSVVFRELGGFENSRMIGDFVMWHKIALNNSVVLLPQGLIWYRVHGEQEIKDHSLFGFDYLNAALHFINIDNCPLSISQRKIINDKLNRLRFKKSMSFLIKHPKLSMINLKNINYSRLFANRKSSQNLNLSSLLWSLF